MAGTMKNASNGVGQKHLGSVCIRGAQIQSERPIEVAQSKNVAV